MNIDAGGQEREETTESSNLDYSKALIASASNLILAGRIIGRGLAPPLESLMFAPELFVFACSTRQRRRFTLLIWLSSMLVGWIATGHSAAAEVALRLSTFRVDVTPPIGDGPCVGCMPKVASIEHPLELRGIVLRADKRTFVIAAIDYCGICNTSDETIRGAMAHAAGTTIDQVALQSLHQHSAPILDADAVRFLHGEKSEQLAQHLRFTDDIASRTATAIAESLKRMQPVTRIVGSKAKVDRVASNRRVPQPDGSIAVRGSVTREAAVRHAPEGLIDPWLRTLTFFDGERKLVQLHYYATHPQTFYGDARISWDSVGMARERMQNATGTFQIYFTGCGGNVTVGKYNDGNQASREQLVTRLLDAMRRSDAVSGPGTEELSAERVLEVDGSRLKHTDIVWDSAPIKFTVREEGTFNPELLKMQLAPDQPFQVRLTAAMFSGFGQRLREGYVAQATRLRIGDIDIAHLPGEPFVEFQLFAQQVAARNSFTCVAGYGECGVWYYGPDHIFTDRGGYEQTWSLTGPCQRTVEEALTTLLVRESVPDSAAPVGDDLTGEEKVSGLFSVRRFPRRSLMRFAVASGRGRSSARKAGFSGSHDTAP